MITGSIDLQLFSILGMVWVAVMAIGFVVSVVLLIVVLRARIKEKKKGEQDAYRNY